MNWIKIQDKLPPTHKNVIVLCQPDSIMLMGVYYRKDKEWYLYYSDGYRLLDDRFQKITHWIILPKLPKQKI